MGRSASHIALECALSTRPNLALIGEEVAEQKMTLEQVTRQIADVVCLRAEKGLNYGLVLIPEGLIEFIPEMGKLIAELSSLEKVEQLSKEGQALFTSLPESLQKQLLLDRDPHGNVQVSMIETEKLLLHSTERELKRRGFTGKFAAQSHFFGYEGRAALPSNFDTHYCTALGRLAALLADQGLSGYMTAIGQLHLPVSSWTARALPLTMLMHMEMRKGKKKPVIQKALVDLKGKAFTVFKRERASWASQDLYRFPGPIQFFGSPALTDAPPLTLQVEAT
jgi:pyrophosphate--fructose-6-phosphate 1-phosphotransferase